MRIKELVPLAIAVLTTVSWILYPEDLAYTETFVTGLAVLAFLIISKIDRLEYQISEIEEN